jgi:type IV secretory pathway TraG/TraD family ATPase VirD4
MLACDEYGEIASEVPGQPMGDGHFFSLAREFGCMGLIATQSVNRLQSSSLKDAWRDVFSNFNAKIFMAARDNETAKEASELAGQTTWYLASDGTSRSKDGLSSSRQRELREQTSLPTRVLTHVLQRGQAVVIGTLDGLTASTYFLQVPKAAT